jgi:hypothetical protein
VSELTCPFCGRAFPAWEGPAGLCDHWRFTPRCRLAKVGGEHLWFGFGDVSDVIRCWCGGWFNAAPDTPRYILRHLADRGGLHAHVLELTLGID